MTNTNSNKYRAGEEVASVVDIPLRVQPQGDYCSLDNEAAKVFLPIIGPRAFAIYRNLLQKLYGKTYVTYASSEVAEETHMSKATVWRELQVLEWVGMVRVRFGGGNSKSECQFFDLKALAKKLGATERRGASLTLPEETVQELKGAVAELRMKTQGKKRAVAKDFPQPTAILFLAATQRDAGVSLERRQRLTRETQVGSHLLRKKKIHQEGLSPTPFHGANTKPEQNLSTNDKTFEQLKAIRDSFTGVMDGMRNHLLNPSRPAYSHLANGFEDWERFTFGSFRVEEMTNRGNRTELIISAYDPTVAREGIDKYRRQWSEQMRMWFGRELQVVFVPQGLGEPRGGRGAKFVREHRL